MASSVKGALQYLCFGEEALTELVMSFSCDLSQIVEDNSGDNSNMADNSGDPRGAGEDDTGVVADMGANSIGVGDVASTKIGAELCSLITSSSSAD